jgi:LysR family transcriptional activator of nhaA
MTQTPPSWINYHHLYYFKTIAEEGSVSKAALKLRVGQPTLSSQLKQLERSLGIPLFERRKQRLELTEQGRIALDYARTIFKTGREMVEVLHDRALPTRTSVHLGALDAIPKQVVLELVKAATRIGQCQITLSEGRPDELLGELSRHRIDLLVTNHVPAGVTAKGYHHRVVTRRQVGIYGAPAFRALKRRFPHSISGQPMIVPTYDSKLRYDLEHWARTEDLDLDILVESQDIGVKKLMAAAGLGLMPTAAHAVRRQIQRGELVEIGRMSGVYEQLVLVTAQRKIANPIASRLLATFNL